MTLTPRQIEAYLEFSGKIERLQKAEDLMLTAIGAQGDKNAIDKALKDITGQ
jgi:hypothetical protein